jgi:hypothetical protein
MVFHRAFHSARPPANNGTQGYPAGILVWILIRRAAYIMQAAGRDSSDGEARNRLIQSYPAVREDYRQPWRLPDALAGAYYQTRQVNSWKQREKLRSCTALFAK